MHDNYNGAYSETCETTKMEFFARIVNGVRRKFLIEDTCIFVEMC